jgi:hypothetical protein
VYFQVGDGVLGGYAKDARDIMGLGHEHAGYQLFLFPLIPCMGVRANLLRNK